MSFREAGFETAAPRRDTADAVSSAPDLPALPALAPGLPASRARAPGLPASPARAPALPASPARAPGLAGEAELLAVPPVAVVAPEAVATEQPEGPPIDPVLIRFAAEARGRRLRARGGQGFPVEATEAWQALLDQLDLYLTRPLPQTPLLELVRSLVTLEAEWDYDQRRYGAPPAEVAGLVPARARRLGVRIHAARVLGQTMFVKRPPGRLRWPIENAGLSSGFGRRLHPMTGELHWHGGIDLATEQGRVVAAAGKGYVVRAGWAGGYGMLVEVRHPGELTTRYGHLSAVLCSPGDALVAGQALGTVGQTGIATGPHLHFEVWRGGQPSDPLGWLGDGSQLAGAGGRRAGRKAGGATGGPAGVAMSGAAGGAVSGAAGHRAVSAAGR